MKAQTAIDLKEAHRRPLDLKRRRPSTARVTMSKLHDLLSTHCGILTGLDFSHHAPLFRKARLFNARLEHVTLLSGRGVDRHRRSRPDLWRWETFQGRVGNSLSTDPEKALVGSVGEAIERYAMTMAGRTEEWVTASWTDVRDHAVDPRQFQLYTPDEYAKTTWCKPFHEDAPMRWAWATDLETREPTLVPAQFTWLLYNLLPGEPLLKAQTSNGWAAHNTLEEALGKCINENMERDSFVLMWYNKLRMPLVDLETVRHPRAQELLDILRGVGVELKVISTMTDLHYPTFMAVATNTHPGYAPLTVTMGAGLDPVQGVLRAIEECLGSYIYNTTMLRWGWALDRPEEVHTMMDHFKYYLNPERVPEVEWMWSSPERVDVRDLPRQAGPGDTPLDELERAVHLLAKAGFRNYAVDTTPPDLDEAGFKTAKVVCPQICQMEFGHGLIGKNFPRLYEAPVRMGYRERPLSPDELNTQIHPHS